VRQNDVATLKLLIVTLAGLLATYDALPIKLASVCSTEAVSTVYNLRVADHHAYFVGGSVWGWDVWVHNQQYNVHQTPIRPGVRNRPDPARSIDTRVIAPSAGHTAQGFPRDNIAFWKEWTRRHPETMIVNRNVAPAILARLAGVVAIG
jgi:hypothetical protein